MLHNKFARIVNFEINAHYVVNYCLQVNQVTLKVETESLDYLSENYVYFYIL